MSFKRHTICRACNWGSVKTPPGIKAGPNPEKLVSVFSLGLNPLANAFAGQNDMHSAYYPLEVLMCPRCKLAQLSCVVPPAQLYSNYSYVTSHTQTMLDHFKSLWECIWDRHPNPTHVLEIGSNDGTLLQYLNFNGAESVLGIDPAKNLCDQATELGMRSICGLFDASTTPDITTVMPKVDVVIARHVFCHMDNWHEFIKNLDSVCQKDTLVCIEVPYVMDLLKEVQFDTIYHEHLSYLNVKAMVALLESTVFKLDHIQHFPIHCGAIVLYLRRRDYNGSADDSVAWYLDQENKGLNEDAWKKFDWDAKLNIMALKNKVTGLKADGKMVCGIGASAKSTVWVNACGFTRKQISFIADSTPQKQNKYSPGTDIPIVDEGAMIRDYPDYAVVFCWNFLSEVMAKNKTWMDRGGKFIVPVPTVRVIEQKDNL